MHDWKKAGFAAVRCLEGMLFGMIARLPKKFPSPE
jgi:hypothetical protein